MQTIRTPDGQVFKFPATMSRDQIAEALKRRLGNQTVQQPNVTPAKPTGDTSMGTAFKLGDAGAVSASHAGMASLNRNLENSWVGDAYKYLGENIGNPLRETFGLEPTDFNALAQTNQAKLDKAANVSAEYLEQLQKDLNFQNLETSDIKDLGSFVNYVAQKGAQAAPYMGAILASGGSLTYPFMVGEVSQSLDEIEGLDQAQKDDIAAVGGAVMAALENLGIGKLLPKGTSNKIIGGIAKGLITEGTTEGMQELVLIGSEAVAGKQFGEGEIVNRLKESVAAGAVVGGSFKGGLTTGAKVKSLFTGDGRLISEGDLSNLPESEKFAAADVARLLDEVSKANGYKLKNVDPSSSQGAKQALEDVRSSNVQAINDLKKVLKKQLDPKNAQSLEQLLSVFSPATAGIAAGKKKVSQKVTTDQLDALSQLVGNTKEGQQLLQELVKSNVITDLFKGGMKGGVSQFTDLFNPLSHSGAVYDPTRYANVFIGGTSAYGTGGASLGIAAGGRVVDFFTGRRSKVAKFVKSNKKALGLPDAEGTSIIEQKAKQKAAAKDRRAAIAQIATILDAPKAGFVENILLGTGLDRSGLETVLNNMASDFGSNPDFTALLDDIQKNLDGEGVAYLDNLSEIIPVIGAYAQAYNPELVTNTPDNPLLKRSFDSPNVQTDMPNMGGGGSQFGAQFAPQENYNRGIQDNLDFVRTLQDGAGKDKKISRVDRGRLITSLENLTNNLGSNPVETVQTEVQKLQDQGVNQDAIDKYVQPYVDRVIRQQRPKGLGAAVDAGVAPDVDTDAETLGQRISDIFNRDKDPDAKLSQTLDLQSLSPKKPQAPTLEPSEIPTETRKAYKLMKVQPSRPNELLPLYAKDGEEGKGSPSGFQLNTWHKAEMQRPMIGGKLLAKRGGIHALNLPVFDQGKAKVKGEQRVWVEVEIPAISPDTQLESDNSPLINNNIREGIKNRLIGTQESYDYKTNPNASNDAGGWPIAGSMKALRIVPDSEISQVLRDNGLDHQVDNSFTGVDEAKALELMGTPEAEPAARLNEQSPILQQPEIPRGETTNIQMPNTLGSAFEFAKNSNFRTGRDFKLALQEKALEAQEKEGIDLSELSEENTNRLADYVLADALEALKNNANAIGWYDRTVTDALNTLSEIYPEILTNPTNKLQFIWALAVTSNGTKVDKNFELAASAYDTLQKTGRFPAKIGIGDAARAIDSGLAQYHTMLNKFNGDHGQLEAFMNSQQPVRDLEKTYGVDISGEGKDTLVRGASILGAKIGNGFFSNLYGNFDALTMDRWLMRTVGRHRGTLIKINRPMIKKKQGEIQSFVDAMIPNKNDSSEVAAGKKAQLKQLRAYLKPSGIRIGKSMTKQNINELAAYIAHKSTSKPWREGLNAISNDLRKSANGLAGYRDGQVEMPAGAKERNFIRSVFSQALDRLNADPAVSRVSNSGLTMSDLQALLWYPEKLLYDSSKAPEGQESRGYKDDEAPDYANAARKLVEARKAVAGQSGLGSTGAAGNGRRGTTSPNARLSDSLPTNIQNALEKLESISGGVLTDPSQGELDFGRTYPTNQEFKSQTELASVPFEIGKEGSRYENGLKDYPSLLRLAKAFNIIAKAYNSQRKMRQGQKGTSVGTAGLFDDKLREARYLVAGTKMGDGRVVGENDSFMTAIHEVTHGIVNSNPDGMIELVDRNFQDTKEKRFNYLNLRTDPTRRGTFEDEIAKLLDIPDADKGEIISELINLQDAVSFNFADGGSQPVRDLAESKKIVERTANKEAELFGDKAAQAYLRKIAPLIGKHQQYTRGTYEMSVDPVIYYLYDPKAFKKLAPKSAKMVQDFFKQSSILQFYNHPLALGVAVVLAMMMKQEQAEEEDQMQGILAQRAMQAGALTA